MTGPDGPDNGPPGSDLILSGARDRIPAPAQSEDGDGSGLSHERNIRKRPTSTFLRKNI